MKALKDFLNEGESSEKGCAMLYFDFDRIKDIHKMIKEEDIYDDESKSFGLETDTHCTLLYGFNDKSTKGADVISKLKESEFPSEIKIKNVSLFENEFDVLKFDVDSKELVEMNTMLTDNFDYTTDYPDYHPHVTIAYLKKGEGKKYVEQLKEQEFTVKPKQLVYSDAKRNKIYEDV